jgi:phosphate transport system permease protein
MSVAFGPTMRERGTEFPRVVAPGRSVADRLFRGIATGAGLLTFAILALIGTFLVLSSLQAFHDVGWGFFGAPATWNPDAHRFGIGALVYWTVVIAVIALVIAVPISIASALFLTEYAPRRIRRALTGLVDLLAAIPSVIYGIWGLAFLQPYLADPQNGVAHWLSANLGFIPIFAASSTNYSSSAFIIGIVLAIMVVPICTSVMREVFSQTPPGEKEAALALGASRWGMIRAVVLPFGRGGIIGGAMLGMGRALGETIAVALIVSTSFNISPHILESGANSVAALIANYFSEASVSHGIPALLAAGLALFVLTLVVNFLAALVVARSRSGKGVEI